MDNERRWHLGVRAAGALAVVLALAGVMLVTVPSGEQADSPVTVSGGTTDEALLIEDLRDFDAWLEDRNGDGAQAARRRAESLRLLAETDPSRALMHAVSPRVKASLPGDVAEHVEDWIHGEATMEVLCPYPYTRAEVLGEEPIDTERVLRHERGAEYEHVLNFDGEAYQARVFGRRLGRVEKAKVPVSAIRLADGVVVVHDQPGLALSSEDAAWMATHDKETGSIRSAQPGVEVGNPDMVCPVSGEPASPDHAAMVGSKIYFFAAHRHIAAYNELLAEEEDHPSRRRFTNDATIGSLRTLVIIVDFSDGSPATTAANYELIMQTTNTFWNINSYGLSSYTDPIEYVTVSLGSKGSYSGCPISNGKSSTLDDDAWAQAALAGKNEGDYDRYLIVFEAYAACLWAGLGSIANTGTWINGLVDPVDHWHIAAHELGHNYGLKHANLWFGGETSPIGSGSSLPYGDDFDIMGAVTIDFDRSSFHVNVQKKNGLDWIPDSDVTDVTATGTYRVFAHDAIDYDDNVRGVKINQAGNKYYWIEYRQNIAYGPSADAFANGANIHWGYQTAGFEQETDLLDMTPAYVSDNLYDTAINNCPLQLATTFSDASNEIFITPTNKGSFFGHPYLDVFVYIGSNAGNNNPTADDITASCTTPEVDEPILLKIENVVDVDNDFLSYKWDFGDGSLNTVNAQQVSHAFSSTGSKTVTVIITDMRGGTATASTVTPIVVASSGSGSCPPCPNNCNGNGLCSGGACDCAPGFTGDDCFTVLNVDEVRLNYVTNVNGGAVVTVTGTGFGQVAPPGNNYGCNFEGVAMVMHPDATYVSDTEVRCLVPDSPANQTVAVEYTPNGGLDFSASQIGFTYGGGFCPSNCSGHGSCDTGPGICYCVGGYSDADCAQVIATTSIDVDIGPTSGQTQVVLGVSGFSSGGASYRCRFGATAPVAATYDGGMAQLSCTSPQYGLAGTVQVQASPNGRDWTVVGQTFNYQSITTLVNRKTVTGQTVQAGDLAYFRIYVGDAAADLTVAITSAVPTVYIRPGVVPTGPTYANSVSGTSSVVINPGSSPASEAGDYFIVVENTSGAAVNFDITATVGGNVASIELVVDDQATVEYFNAAEIQVFSVVHIENEMGTVVVADVLTGDLPMVYISDDITVIEGLTAGEAEANAETEGLLAMGSGVAAVQTCDEAQIYYIGVDGTADQEVTIQATNVAPPSLGTIDGLEAGAINSIARKDTRVELEWPYATSTIGSDFNFTYEAYYRLANAEGDTFDTPCTVKAADLFMAAVPLDPFKYPNVTYEPLDSSTSFEMNILVRNQLGVEAVYSPIAQRTKPPSLPQDLIYIIGGGSLGVAIIAGIVVAYCKVRHKRKKKRRHHHGRHHAKPSAARRGGGRKHGPRREGVRAGGTTGGARRGGRAAAAGGARGRTSGTGARSGGSSAKKERILGLAKANFVAENSNELSFSKNDQIVILGKAGSGWLRGELNGRTGLVPQSFVKLMKEKRR